MEKLISNPALLPLSLLRNVSWTFFGNILYSACRWGILVVLTKLGSTQMVGQFALGLAIVEPVILFTNLHLRLVQATDANREYSFSDYIALRIVTSLCALLVISIIVNGASYKDGTIIVIIAIGMSKVVDSFSDIFYGLLQQHERMDRIAKSLIFRGLLSLATLSIVFYLTGKLYWGIGGLTLAWALVLVSYDIPNGQLILHRSLRTSKDLECGTYVMTKTLMPQFKLRKLWGLTCLALPLGIVMMLISFNTNMNRYFIERYLGEAELGIFAAMTYIMIAGSTVANALGQSATPRLAVYYAGSNVSAFCALLLRLVGIGIILGGSGVLLALLGGKELLTLIYRPEYAERSDVLLWLMVAAVSDYVATFLGYGMTAARQFRVQVPLFSLVSVISALAYFWLIPIAGLKGAAISLLIGSVMQTGLSILFLTFALRKSLADVAVYQ
jgi:O-antigen/teichoic acid export membrane protein